MDCSRGCRTMQTWVKEPDDQRCRGSCSRGARPTCQGVTGFKTKTRNLGSGTLYRAQFYSSVVDTEGLPSFLKMGRSRRPAELWAYSPYWGSVAELVGEFGAKRTVLVPAMRADRKALGLSKSQHEASARTPLRSGATKARRRTIASGT